MSKTATEQKEVLPANYSRSYSSKEEWSGVQHAMAYLNIADDIPHRSEGEAVLLEHIPTSAQRVLDLGTGNGRLLRIININQPHIEAVGVDISPVMLKAARESFTGDNPVKIIETILMTHS
jgi:tRNA (cmo5U34)-methyltransferase